MVISEEGGHGKGATGRFSALGFTFKVLGGSRGSQETHGEGWPREMQGWREGSRTNLRLTFLHHSAGKCYQ